MKAKWLGILLFVGFIFLILKFTSRESTQAPSVETSQEVAESKPADVGAIPSVTSVSIPAVEKPDHLEAVQPTSLRASAPNVQTVRDEVEKNPHEMPPSIRKFATDLGEKMQLAMDSETEAQKLFPEIEDCALDIPKSTYASTPRALCYNDAIRLAQKYPSLQQNLEHLTHELDPETLKQFHPSQKILQGR